MPQHTPFHKVKKFYGESLKRQLGPKQEGLFDRFLFSKEKRKVRRLEAQKAMREGGGIIGRMMHERRRNPDIQVPWAPSAMKILKETETKIGAKG